MLNIYNLYNEINHAAPFIRLDAGEPDIPVRKEIIETAMSSLRKGETGYTEIGGIPDLREAIADIEGVSPQEVIIGAGAKHLISAEIAHAKRVAFIAPFWNAYYLISREFGKKIQVIPTELDNKWTPVDMDLNADLLILNYPNNPTGKVLSRNELKPIVDAAMEKGIKILSDEVYGEISFVDFTSPRELYENTVTVKGFSKLFSMTGFRLGYALANKEEINHIKSFIETTVTCVPLFVQKAGLKALELREDIKKRVVRVYRHRAHRALQILKSLDFYPPEGAFYIFLKVSLSGEKLMYELLEKGIAVFPGSIFGNYPDFMRISLTHRDYEYGLHVIREMLK